LLEGAFSLIWNAKVTVQNYSFHVLICFTESTTFRDPRQGFPR
jgi:hypothetical protein